MSEYIRVDEIPLFMIKRRSRFAAFREELQTRTETLSFNGGSVYIGNLQRGFLKGLPYFPISEQRKDGSLTNLGHIFPEQKVACFRLVDEVTDFVPLMYVFRGLGYTIVANNKGPHVATKLVTDLKAGN